MLPLVVIKPPPQLTTTRRGTRGGWWEKRPLLFIDRCNRNSLQILYPKTGTLREVSRKKFTYTGKVLIFSPTEDLLVACLGVHSCCCKNVCGIRPRAGGDSARSTLLKLKYRADHASNLDTNIGVGVSVESFISPQWTLA